MPEYCIQRFLLGAVDQAQSADGLTPAALLRRNPVLLYQIQHVGVGLLRCASERWLLLRTGPCVQPETAGCRRKYRSRTRGAGHPAADRQSGAERIEGLWGQGRRCSYSMKKWHDLSP